MTDETISQFILDYRSESSKKIQIAHLNGYDFTFLIQDDKAIRGILDINGEPQVHVLEEYRGSGFGSHLLKKYIVVNELIGSNRDIFYNACPDDGEKLIESFSELYHKFKVIKVDERKQKILRDHRF